MEGRTATPRQSIPVLIASAKSPRHHILWNTAPAYPPISNPYPYPPPPPSISPAYPPTHSTLSAAQPPPPHSVCLHSCQQPLYVRLYPAEIMFHSLSISFFKHKHKPQFHSHAHFIHHKTMFPIHTAISTHYPSLSLGQKQKHLPFPISPSLARTPTDETHTHIHAYTGTHRYIHTKTCTHTHTQRNTMS